MPEFLDLYGVTQVVPQLYYPAAAAIVVAMISGSGTYINRSFTEGHLRSLLLSSYLCTVTKNYST